MFETEWGLLLVSVNKEINFSVLSASQALNVWTLLKLSRIGKHLRLVLAFYRSFYDVILHEFLQGGYFGYL